MVEINVELGSEFISLINGVISKCAKVATESSLVKIAAFQL